MRAQRFTPGSRRPWEFLFVNLSGRCALQMTGDLITRFGHLYPLAPDCDGLRQLTAFQPFCNVGYTLPPGESVRLAMGLLHALALSKLTAIESHADRVLADQYEAASPSVFVRAFKHVMQATPSQFQEQSLYKVDLH